MLAQALTICSRPTAYLGTIGYGLPSQLTATTHTTSDAVSVHRQLEEVRQLGAQNVGMEVTSHALDQGRVNAVRFHTAVFTNLTRDHLDYHGTMEKYAAAKALLFAWPGVQARVINVDDEFGASLAELSRRTRGSSSPPARNPRGLRSSCVRRACARQSSGLVIGIESSWGVGEVAAPFVGDFNVDNVLTVLATLLAWGVPLADATRALSKCRPPSGRMETFGGSDSLPLAVVDYAHTPDALSKALRAARVHCRGRLHVVFGCGGDRDRGKRPLMGTIAAELADDIVITDDNPRTEDPRQITAEICAGLRPGAPGAPVVVRAASVRVEHDRKKAIRSALDNAPAGDVVVVAGKGHEDYQIYGTERRPFSDQAVITEYLRRAGMKRTLERIRSVPAAVGSSEPIARTRASPRTRARLRAGELFVALHGPNFNGNTFVEAALKAGAAGAVVDAAAARNDPADRRAQHAEGVGEGRARLARDVLASRSSALPAATARRP